MKTIKFFHQEETMTYHIEKCFCKVVLSNKQHLLIIEIHSNDDLYHVDEDALQNHYPQVSLFLDDFPVAFKNKTELIGQEIEIPKCYVEIKNEDGETEEIFYTDVKVLEDDFESDSNVLNFFRNDAGNLCLNWKGETQDFTENSDDMIPFELECEFSEGPADE